jgi:subtilisin-like proprotein convertase family protein
MLRRRAENGNWRLEVQDAGNGMEMGWMGWEWEWDNML